MCLAYDPRLKLQQWLLEAQLPKTLARNESIMFHRADARRKNSALNILVCLLLVHVVGEGRGQAGAKATSAAVEGPISSFVFELRQQSGGGHSMRIASAAARLAPKSGVPIQAAPLRHCNTNLDDGVGSSGTGATKAANERKGKAVSARSASAEVQSNLEPAIQNQREIESGLVQALQGLRVSPLHTSQIRGTRSNSVKSTDSANCTVRARGKATKSRRRRSRQVVSTPMMPGNNANASAGINSINSSSTVAPSSRAMEHMFTDTARDGDSNEAEDKVERERAQVGTTLGAEREETEGGGGGRVEENQDGAGELTGWELNTSRFLPSRGRVVGKSNRYSLVLLITVFTHESPACTTYHVTHTNKLCHTYT